LAYEVTELNQRMMEILLTHIDNSASAVRAHVDNRVGEVRTHINYRADEIQNQIDQIDHVVSTVALNTMSSNVQGENEKK